GATGLFLALGAYLAAASVACVPAPARRQALLAVGALGGAVALPVLAPSWTVPAAAVAFGAVALSRALGGKGARDPYGIRHFLRERPLPDREGFTPRPEHAQLVTRPAAPPRPSAAHGLLRGRDVILLTFESVGRSHLSAFSRGGACTPFLEGLLPGALRSRHHACVSPTTNNAHLALYGSRYGEARFAGIRALRDAGYRTVYLTAARCAEYGLRSILDGAGFEHVVDRAVLGRDRAGPLGDEVLVSEGLDRLAPLLSGGGPFFLHVHATNTHVPYRVADPERFRRFDPTSDHGRFLNGIEECDALFGALLDGLKARGLTQAPLIVVSSDHGQAFGELGYHSHGSAITRDQLDVPLLFHHPELALGEVPFSSHFDVLPTMLDLLGLSHDEPIFGDSLLHPDRRPEMLVWAGHPSRATTSHYGVLLDGEKLMVDLVLDRCWRMDWRDERVEELSGAEKEYASALASRLMALRRVA
ncbi:MAG TPA: sulfatase-like hydrolase/transferase, partial [Myxococcaceae bacterium]|nr:sulfatase-like hydrolase/transferase [Myxococcaceae bacterium]